MKRYTISLLLLLWLSRLNGQDIFISSTDSDAVFAQSCYAELKKIIGDTRSNLPELKVSKTKEHIALYNSKKNQIIVEQATIEACKEFGDNDRGMLIYLLGHEFAHFQQKTNGHRSFFKTSLPDQSFWAAQKKLEEEADQYGIFVAYLGGYALEDITVYLDKIYKQYELPNTLENYPSLAQRKAFVQKADKQVQKLLDIYEIGNYYTAMGYYLPAIACYQYLLRAVQTKELHNNLGTAILGLVLSHDRYSFYLPIEADWTPCIQKRQGLVFFESKKTALAMAINHFEQACGYEQNYFSGQLNLCCALLLMENQTNNKRIEELLKLLKLTQKTREREAIVTCLEGIYIAQKGDKKRAIELWKQAKKRASTLNLKRLIKKNIKQLNKEESLVSIPKPSLHSTTVLDGIELSTLKLEEVSFEKSIVLHSVEGCSIVLYMKDLSKSKLSCISIEGVFDSMSWWLQRVEQQTLTTAAKISVGNSQATLENTYRQLSAYGQLLKDGEIISYPQIHHVFRVKNDKVVQWALEAH